MEINENLTKLIFQEFDDSIRGTDIYNHDGTMWLIFTEERKWVVEFTKQKTLWYNYKHFNDILILFGMELSEGDDYIKKWYEDKFISEDIIEDTIQNGVKNVQEIYENSLNSVLFEINCKKAIKKGVKYVFEGKMQAYLVNDVIEDGVKEVEYYDGDAEVLVNEAIKSKVKEILSVDCDYNRTTTNVIKNGVKLKD